MGKICDLIERGDFKAFKFWHGLSRGMHAPVIRSFPTLPDSTGIPHHLLTQHFKQRYIFLEVYVRAFLGSAIQSFFAVISDGVVLKPSLRSSHNSYAHVNTPNLNHGDSFTFTAASAAAAAASPAEVHRLQCASPRAVPDPHDYQEYVYMHSCLPKRSAPNAHTDNPYSSHLRNVPFTGHQTNLDSEESETEFSDEEKEYVYYVNRPGQQSASHVWRRHYPLILCKLCDSRLVQILGRRSFLWRKLKGSCDTCWNVFVALRHRWPQVLWWQAQFWAKMFWETFVVLCAEIRVSSHDTCEKQVISFHNDLIWCFNSDTLTHGEACPSVISIVCN